MKVERVGSSGCSGTRSARLSPRASSPARLADRRSQSGPEATWLEPGISFELLESKLQSPRSGRRSVPRTRLVERLNRSTEPPIVVVRAGPGYGKTTVLAQWVASHDPAKFAWVSADQDDNDPVVLLTYIAAALDRVSPLGSDVFAGLASPGASIEAKILPRLGHALASMDTPFVLVIDDAHVIENPRCVDAIMTLAEHLPEGSRLALSTRDQSALPLGLLRTRALLLELAAEELRMDGEEVRALLSAEAVNASEEDIAELLRRTEGWPAGVYLAALSAKAAGSAPGGVATLTGKDPFVVDFLRSEFLARLPRDELRFLTRTSVLERLSGPICDAVLGSTDSSQMLESLERSNRFVVALDRNREWYRCHHLVREMLAAELAGSQPDQHSLLLGRAIDWCAANGDDIAAIRYAQAAGDVQRVSAAMVRGIQPTYQSGRSATVEQWLAWLEAHDDLERHPAVAVIGAMFHAASGRPTEAERWGDASERGGYQGTLPDGSRSIESWRALLRAFRCRDGVEAMRADARLAVRTIAPESEWHPRAVAHLGVAELLEGNVDAADDLFSDAAEEGRQLGSPNMIPVALAERAIIAIAREEWVRADTLAEHAVWAARRTRLEDAAINALAYAVAARTALRSGRRASAHDLLAQAQGRVGLLTYALPIPAVQTRLQMTRTYLELADRGGARVMLAEMDAILRRLPRLGTLPGEVAELRSKASSAAPDARGAAPLTAAELRVLPLLTTHLTFKEIGERLFLSRHTVKSHAMSIYRKLGATSRGGAVQRAREVGLL